MTMPGSIEALKVMIGRHVSPQHHSRSEAANEAEKWCDLHRSPLASFGSLACQALQLGNHQGVVAQLHQSVEANPRVSAFLATDAGQLFHTLLTSQIHSAANFRQLLILFAELGGHSPPKSTRKKAQRHR